MLTLSFAAVGQGSGKIDGPDGITIHGVPAAVSRRTVDLCPPPTVCCVACCAKGRCRACAVAVEIVRGMGGARDAPGGPCPTEYP